MKINEIIEIKWEDSGSNDGVWVSKDDYPNEAGECSTLGYFIEKTKKAIVVCQCLGGNQYGNVFVIPRQNIKKIAHLK